MKTILDIINFHKEKLKVITKKNFKPETPYFAIEYFGKLERHNLGILSNYSIRDFQSGHNTICLWLTSDNVHVDKHIEILNLVIEYLGNDSNGKGKNDTFLKSDTFRCFEYDTNHNVLNEESENYAYSIILMYENEKSTLEIINYEFLIKSYNLYKNWC